jgi:type II secretory pathway pseudopilin PulG
MHFLGLLIAAVVLLVIILILVAIVLGFQQNPSSKTGQTMTRERLGHLRLSQLSKLSETQDADTFAATLKAASAADNVMYTTGKVPLPQDTETKTITSQTGTGAPLTAIVSKPDQTITVGSGITCWFTGSCPLV